MKMDKINCQIEIIDKIVNKQTSIKSREEENRQLRHAISRLLSIVEKCDKVDKEIIGERWQVVSVMLSAIQNNLERPVLRDALCILSEIFGKSISLRKANNLIKQGVLNSLLSTLVSEAQQEISIADDLLILLHSIIYRIGIRDRKFGLKCRLSGAIKVTMNLLKQYTNSCNSPIANNSSTLYPLHNAQFKASQSKNMQTLLHVIRLSAQNMQNANSLGKSGLISLLLRIIMTCGKNNLVLLKVTLECLHIVIRTKTNSVRLVNLGGVAFFLQFFIQWQTNDQKHRQISIKKSLLKVLKSATNTRCGRKAFLETNGLQNMFEILVNLYRNYGIIEKSVRPDVDSMQQSISLILRKCFPRNHLPLTRLDSAYRCFIDPLNRLNRQGSDMSTNSLRLSVGLPQMSTVDNKLTEENENGSESENEICAKGSGADEETDEEIVNKPKPAMSTLLQYTQRSLEDLRQDYDILLSEITDLKMAPSDIILPDQCGGEINGGSNIECTILDISNNKTVISSCNSSNSNLILPQPSTSRSITVNSPPNMNSNMSRTLRLPLSSTSSANGANNNSFLSTSLRRNVSQPVLSSELQPNEVVINKRQIDKSGDPSSSCSYKRGNGYGGGGGGSLLRRQSMDPPLLTPSRASAESVLLNTSGSRHMPSLAKLPEYASTSATRSYNSNNCGFNDSIEVTGDNTNDFLISDESASFTYNYINCSRNTYSLGHFVMLGYPDLMNTKPPEYSEPFYVNDCSANNLISMENNQSNNETNNKTRGTSNKTRSSAKKRTSGRTRKVSQINNQTLTSAICVTGQVSKILDDLRRVVDVDDIIDRVVYDLDALIAKSSTPINTNEPDILDDGRPLENLDSSSRGIRCTELKNSDELLVDTLPSTTGVTSKQLIFESRFECGNLRKAIQIRQSEYDLILNPDCNTNHHMQWFYFRLHNYEPGVPYRFNIINNEKPNSQFNFGMQPLMFSVREALCGNPCWRRCGTEIYYYRNQYSRSTLTTGGVSGRFYYTATFMMTFSVPNDVIYLAYHYPYTYTRLMADFKLWQRFVNQTNANIFMQQQINNLTSPTLSDVGSNQATADCHYKRKSSTTNTNNNELNDKVHHCPIYFKIQRLCQTLLGNEVPVVTITANNCTTTEADDVNGNHLDVSKRPYIFLTSRVHPGESNASWVMSGLINFLLSSHPQAEQLRQSFIFKIVPMLNPDGVILGNHRCCIMAEDLNRKWHDPSIYSHPVIYHTKGLLTYLSKIDKPPLIFCDMHGHSRKKNVFLYGCSSLQSWINPDMENPAYIDGRIENHGAKLLPKVLSMTAPAFSWYNCSFAIDRNKESTARVVAWRQLGIIRSYTMESTYAGCDQGRYAGQHINIQMLEEMGQSFAVSLLKVFASVSATTSTTTPVTSTTTSATNMLPFMNESRRWSDQILSTDILVNNDALGDCDRSSDNLAYLDKDDSISQDSNDDGGCSSNDNEEEYSSEFDMEEDQDEEDLDEDK